MVVFMSIAAIITLVLEIIKLVLEFMARKTLMVMDAVQAFSISDAFGLLHWGVTVGMAIYVVRHCIKNLKANS